MFVFISNMNIGGRADRSDGEIELASKKKVGLPANSTNQRQHKIGND